MRIPILCLITAAFAVAVAALVVDLFTDEPSHHIVTHALLLVVIANQWTMMATRKK